MAKSNSTKAKTEPAAEEQEVGNTTPATAEEQEDGTTAPAATEGQQEGSINPEDLTAMPFELYVVDAPYGLNLRKAPRFGAKVLGILPDGTEISVALGVDGPEGWLPVLENDSVCGWVFARCVKKIEE